ncbi:hypothetical protein GCM10023191_097520 [Actinoallomurus oryzae]|uniref:Uncharacterized protein n=1 Tax=Actinoallomurus oryzae TaxID=502180 RepID=A0ABP8R7Y9_9ACTN
MAVLAQRTGQPAKLKGQPTAPDVILSRWQQLTETKIRKIRGMSRRGRRSRQEARAGRQSSSRKIHGALSICWLTTANNDLD